MAIVDRDREASVADELNALIKEARERQRRRRRRVMIASLALLTLGGVIAAGFGPGGPRGGQAVRRPQPAGIAARVADPSGGPPWGIRIVRGGGGLTCVQLGRLHASTLGVIGQDGAFANDGGFHPIPPSTVIAARCVSTDASGHAFLNTLDWGQPASGAVLTADGGDLKKCGLSICPERDLRLVQYGLLGPDAVNVTYKLADRINKIPTGPDGAYLIVASPSKHLCALLVGAAACGSGTAEFNDPNSVAGLLISVRYRGRRTANPSLRARAPDATSRTDRRTSPAVPPRRSPRRAGSP